MSGKSTCVAKQKLAFAWALRKRKKSFGDPSASFCFEKKQSEKKIAAVFPDALLYHPESFHNP